jgi:hypothetical protein
MNRPPALSLSFRTWLFSTAILAGLLMPAAIPDLHAETPDQCQRRIEHKEHDLHEAIEHHGRHSREANHERRELREARERCWRENHRWWDYHERRWRQERDWDDRDHDRD